MWCSSAFETTPMLCLEISPHNLHLRLCFSYGGIHKKEISLWKHSEHWFEDKHWETVKKSVKKWMWQNCQPGTKKLHSSFGNPLYHSFYYRYRGYLSKRMKLKSLLLFPVRVHSLSLLWLMAAVCTGCIPALLLELSFSTYTPPKKINHWQVGWGKKNPRQMAKETNIWCFILQIVINFNFIL